MTIPKYVKETLSRSCYEFDHCTKHPDYSGGYTIRVKKSTPYTYADTLRAEVEKLCAWANRQACEGTACILYTPDKTHHADQFAVVTIFDPIMQKIEHYIGAAT